MNLPKHKMVYSHIKYLIESGEYRQGDTLDSEKKLSELYDVSITTIRHAKYHLVRQGMIEQKSGMKCVIGYNASANKLSFGKGIKKTSCSSNIHRKLLPVPNGDVLGDFIEIFSAEVPGSFHLVEYLEADHSCTLGYVQCFIPLALSGKVNEVTIRKSGFEQAVLPYCREMEIHKLVSVTESVVAGECICRKLGLPCEAIMIKSTNSYISSDDRIIFLHITLYRGDRVSLTSIV